MWWNYIIPLLTAIPLFVMAIEDYRKREIHVLWLALFVIFVIVNCALEQSCITILSNMFYNSLILCLLLASICIWLYIRKREFVNPFIRHLGWGDIIFLWALTPVFNLRGYLIYLIVSSSISIIYWVVYNKLIQKRHNRYSTIPLVTMAGITYFTYLIFNI
jgi:Flp pilus assembly protein protease CpaA